MMFFVSPEVTTSRKEVNELSAVCDTNAQVRCDISRNESCVVWDSVLKSDHVVLVIEVLSSSLIKYGILLRFLEERYCVLSASFPARDMIDQRELCEC